MVVRVSCLSVVCVRDKLHIQRLITEFINESKHSGLAFRTLTMSGAQNCRRLALVSGYVQTS